MSGGYRSKKIRMTNLNQFLVAILKGYQRMAESLFFTESKNHIKNNTLPLIVTVNKILLNV